jgi:hypothetical protein
MQKIMLALIPALLISSCAKMVVVKVPADKDDKKKVVAEGVFYALPLTVVHLNLKVDRSAYKVAPYQDYAAIFWPDGDVVCDFGKCAEKNARYSLQKGATFSTFGEPDPKNVYMVKFVGRGAVDQSMTLAWTDTGLISTATGTVTNRTSDVIVSGLKLAAGIGAKAGFGASAVTKAAADKVKLTCPAPSDNDDWILTKLSKTTADPGQSVLSTAASSILIGNYCSIKKEDRAKAPYNFSSAHDALLNDAITAYILHMSPLVEARTKLLGGGSPSYGPMDLVNKIETLLDQQAKALYLGTKSTKTWEAGLDVRDAETGAYTILHLDPAAGVCLGTHATIAPDSKPLPDGFGENLDKDACEKAPAISLKIESYPAKQLVDAVETYTSEPSGDRSFRYRIPRQVKAELTSVETGDDKKTKTTSYGVAVFSMAQAGEVRSLPASRHSKGLTYTLGMVEATGGLKNFALSTTGSVDAGTIDSLSSVAGTLLDARNASNAADKTAALADKASKDELTVLTRQDQLLKLKDDICTLQKKYGIDCAVQP